MEGKVRIQNDGGPITNLLAPDGKQFYEHGILVKRIALEHVAGNARIEATMDVVFDPRKFDLDLSLSSDQIALTVGETMEARLVMCGLEGWTVELKRKVLE